MKYVPVIVSIMATYDSSAKISYSESGNKAIKRTLIQMLEYATGRSILERKLNKVLKKNPSEWSVWGDMLVELNISLQIDQNKLSKIPKKGPLILIANHPFGVVDGIAMAHVASQIRPHFKALVNEVLCKHEIISSCFLPVNFNDTREAKQTNISSRKEAIRYLKMGGAIIIFPAGGVSTSPKIFKKAEDLEWKQFVVKLIDKTSATVVPIYFDGQNSQLFQIASLINMNLRYGLFLNEVKNKIGKRISISVGDPIGNKQWDHFKRMEILPYLREKVYSLKVKS